MANAIKQDDQGIHPRRVPAGRGSRRADRQTPLITGGVLDSIATLKLVLFSRSGIAIKLEAHEVDPEHLDTIADIARLIVDKNPKASHEQA